MRRGVWIGLSALTMLVSGYLHSSAVPTGSGAQDSDCVCEGQLSRPKTFERTCIGPIGDVMSIPNKSCDPIEVPELCWNVLARRVSGSSCSNLGWTSEFTPIGEETGLMCWSQKGLPPCSELKRYWRLDFACTQRQCVDCTRRETDENGNEREINLARWCRTLLWASWHWWQEIRRMELVCCPSPPPNPATPGQEVKSQ